MHCFILKKCEEIGAREKQWLGSSDFRLKVIFKLLLGKKTNKWKTKRGPENAELTTRHN